MHTVCQYGGSSAALKRSAAVKGAFFVRCVLPFGGRALSCSCAFRSYYSWRWPQPANRFDSAGCILCRSPALGVQSSHRMPQTHR